MGRSIRKLSDDFYDGGDIEVYCGRVVFAGNMANNCHVASNATFAQRIPFFSFIFRVFCQEKRRFCINLY